MWDPETYLRYGDERSRPFFDLTGRIGARRPRAVVDLGCGPGNLTMTLARRWPDARISGLDSSSEMIEKARAADPTLDFAVADIRNWRPAGDVDVVVSNAALQWVPDQELLLARWAGELPAGAWLAVQVPGNFDAPSHLALREVVTVHGWADRLADGIGPRAVPGAAGYAELLTAAGCRVDAWETTYLHRLPPDPETHPVLRWMEGTALRPVRAALTDDEWARLRAALAPRLAEAYPPAADGWVPFPFRRVFAVAQTGPGQPGNDSEEVR